MVTDGFLTYNNAKDPLLQSVINSPKSILIFALNKNYEFISFNENYKNFIDDFFNIKIKIGLNLLDYLDGVYKTKLKNNFDCALNGEQYTFVDVIVKGKAEYFENNYNPIKNKTGEIIGLSGFIINITSQIELIDELEESKKIAEKANNAKSQFLANMSHEIRTPLNAMQGFVELLSTTNIDSKQKSYIDSIITSEKTLLSLINEILDLSKIEAGKIKLEYDSINISQLLNEIILIFKLQAIKKNVDILLEIDNNIPKYLYFDEMRLRQILINLVSNSIKFTDTGFVQIKIYSVSKTADSKIDIVIEVIDTGLGIKKDNLEKIFDPFVQQDNQDQKYGGTGLGLTITKELVKLMNGKIEVKSEVNKGSVFKLNFMNVIIPQTPSNKLNNEETDIEKIKFEDSKILIVEDNLLNRTFVKEFFNKTNIEVTEATNGKEAIDIIINNKPDLILMDIKMPIMDGFEAANLIKNYYNFKNIPIIALTSHAMTEDINKIENFNFDGYLIKPVTKSQLFREISRFLKHSINTETFCCFQVANNLKQKLKNEIEPAIKKIMQTNFVDDYILIGTKIIEFAKINEVKELENIGYSLIDYSNNFEIDNINKIITMILSEINIKEEL